MKVRSSAEVGVVAYTQGPVADAVGPWTGEEYDCMCDAAWSVVTSDECGTSDCSMPLTRYVGGYRCAGELWYDCAYADVAWCASFGCLLCECCDVCSGGCAGDVV